MVYNGLKSVATKCAEPMALISVYCTFNWTEVQPYKMFRADGSMKCVKCESSVGTTNIVATDFNPLLL